MNSKMFLLGTIKLVFVVITFGVAFLPLGGS